jgi:hypothetical protein
MRRLSIFGIILVLVVFLGGCEVTGSSQSGVGTATSSSSSTFGPEPNWGVQTKTTGCQADGPIQDKACTPGAIFPDATKEQICTPGYAGSVRNVTQSTKNKVYAAYGVKTHTTGQYEVDHLVSLQLGGNNQISNLWPEPASPKPGFHEKDRVENYLHDEMCKGNISVREAQIQIATNWLAVYDRMPKSNTNEKDEDEE